MYICICIYIYIYMFYVNVISYINVRLCAVPWYHITWRWAILSYMICWHTVCYGMMSLTRCNAIRNIHDLPYNIIWFAYARFAESIPGRTIWGFPLSGAISPFRSKTLFRSNLRITAFLLCELGVPLASAPRRHGGVQEYDSDVGMWPEPFVCDPPSACLPLAQREL